MIIILIFLRIISWALSAFEICMFARAILSWFPSTHSSNIYYFLCMITDPPLIPIRKFLMQFRWVRNCPLDISFLVLWVLVSGVIGFVQTLIYIL